MEGVSGMTTRTTTAIGSTTPTAVLETAQRRRSELASCVTDVSMTLEQPHWGQVEEWLWRTGSSLRRLRHTIEEHIAQVEAPDGLHAQVLQDEPRLASRVRRLVTDHEILRDRVSAVIALSDRPCGSAPDPLIRAVRGEALLVLDLLERHRQRGADLMFEAYAQDIGGNG